MIEYLYRIMNKTATGTWVPVSEPGPEGRVRSDLKVWKATGFEVKLQRQEIVPWEDVEEEL